MASSPLLEILLLQECSENIMLSSGNVFSGKFYFSSQNILLKCRITFSKNILKMFIKGVIRCDMHFYKLFEHKLVMGSSDHFTDSDL